MSQSPYSMPNHILPNIRLTALESALLANYEIIQRRGEARAVLSFWSRDFPTGIREIEAITT
ncbi:hypothetical protein BA939_03210 [Rhizobium sp. S41]|nr:hypothetical protein BA939_03210 [Rhizobium sp. S41]